MLVSLFDGGDELMLFETSGLNIELPCALLFSSEMDDMMN